MEEILEILIDTTLDVLKIIPFLFLTYLLLEWLEKQTDKRFEEILKKHNRLSVLYGALLGLFPSCGFSSAASSLYATGVISAGALTAVYLSTSDEMLAIMLSNQAPFSKVYPILLTKLIIAILAGYILHFMGKKKEIAISDFCERENDDHSHGILHSAIGHTLQVTLWLFIITLLLNALIEGIGLENIQSLITQNPRFSIILCSLVGMIPSCASSIILSTLYLQDVIPFAPVCAGLLANAGTGAIVLFRVHPKIKEKIQILLYVLLVSLLSGWILQMIL